MRSFGRHHDRAIGVDLVSAGQDPRGVFSGTYDPAIPGRIRWSATPELDLSTVSAAGISGSNGYLHPESDRLVPAEPTALKPLCGVFFMS